MIDVSLLVGRRLDDVAKRDHIWEFAFSGGLGLEVGCLWRLLFVERLRLTSEDHGHQFGLPAPVDCLTELRQQIVGASVTAAAVRVGTVDMSLGFDGGYTLEVIATSAGYEAWLLGGGGLLMVGQPGYE